MKNGQVTAKDEETHKKLYWKKDNVDHFQVMLQVVAWSER